MATARRNIPNTIWHKEAVMARPIAPTPVLTGEDAKRFIERAKNPQPFTPPQVDTEKLARFARNLLKEREQKHT